jgi:ribosomal protein L18
MAIALKAGKHTAARVASRARRQIRGRKKISGTAERPRLVVPSTLNVMPSGALNVIGWE